MTYYTYTLFIVLSTGQRKILKSQGELQMGLQLSSYITDNLPSTMKFALSKMNPEQQSLFYDE